MPELSLLVNHDLNRTRGQYILCHATMSLMRTALQKMWSPFSLYPRLEVHSCPVKLAVGKRLRDSSESVVLFP